MIKKHYLTLNELFDDVRVIRDRLAQQGANASAAELTDVLEGYWTTSSEALCELLTSLEAVIPACTDILSAEENSFIRHVREGAKSLLNFE